MDYYERLGVSSDASTDEIERAYREKLKETHPDVSDQDDASERTKELIEAKDVLTDEKKRSRYDRLGHEQYVSDGASVSKTTDRHETDARSGARRNRRETDNVSWDSSGNNSGRSRGRSGASGRSSGRSNTAGQSGNRSNTTGRTENRSSASGRSSGATSGASQNKGFDQSRRRNVRDRSQRGDRSTGQANEGWHAWDTDGSYAVRRGEDDLRRGYIFSSDQSLIIVGTIFFVYPVLLYGAFTTAFPVALNLFVGIITVIIIAFLQSIPEVGIVVFGVWSVLLPLILFGSIGISPVSAIGVAVLGAVVFPFFLSVLTWYILRPLST